MTGNGHNPIEAACRLIDEAEAPPGLEALAAAAGMGKFRFHRMFKQATGLTPKAYEAAGRSERLRAAVKEAPSVTEAIYAAG
ncbi:MAG: bifunctional transcriptional activator/DNA repair enzyme protein Ada, partial [Rhodospirillales bacterium]|nr:bifunctional transcriptional activator/DNA repair enzyme protein Ada [Rhodospirillales bacterium]